MLTAEELDVLVNVYVRRNFKPNDSTAKEFIRVFENIVTSWIDYGSVVIPGYAETYDDEVAYMFHSWGCTVTCVQDWVDGSPTYTIAMPTSEEEEAENKRIFAETWAEM